MIYARIINNWVEKCGDADFDGRNATFQTQSDLDSYMSEFESWKPETIYARIDNGWPVEIRDTDWPGRNSTFGSVGEFEEFRADHVANMPQSTPPDESLSEQEIWAQKLAGGWVDQVTGIKLKTSEAARNLFQGQVTMIREALDLGALSNTDQQSIWDFDENEHVMPVIQLRGLLLRYGVSWKQMFDEFAP